jgi:hypothetical protein
MGGIHMTALSRALELHRSGGSAARIVVDHVVPGDGPHPTVAIGTGVDLDTGDVVTFAGDIRAMADLVSAAAAADTVGGPRPMITQVEPWQICHRDLLILQ